MTVIIEILNPHTMQLLQDLEKTGLLRIQSNTPLEETGYDAHYFAGKWDSDQTPQEFADELRKARTTNRDFSFD